GRGQKNTTKADGKGVKQKIRLALPYYIYHSLLMILNTISTLVHLLQFSQVHANIRMYIA
ncbi:MAG TPA: hypothetical protein VF896_13360, partial [Anaerolineales bacterium]